ncbi:MAG: Gfo/Idh/MocA family oxidoreductase [Firmicutes bacterium]|nr:Gfo/Idh/MocA family oxidoreductase [Bacillota bacterium]
MKVCMIGSTGHCNYVLDGIDAGSDVKIVGIAPGSAEEDVRKLCKDVVSKGHAPQKFDDYKRMLDTLKPDIAVVACYFGDHAKVTLAALERGIHVFAEKPVATTFEDLETVKNAFKGAGVCLSAMFGIRYTPWFLTAWKAVRAGAIGKIRVMNAQKSYKLGLRGNHFRNRKMYGGTIPWVGSHAIDWLYWFSGEKFESVYASHSAQYNHNHGDLEVSALCHFTFSNEVFGSVNIDYLRPHNAPSHDDDRIRIAGTSGVIEIRDQNVYLINSEAEGIQALSLQKEENIFVDFLRHVQGTGQCMISAADAFAVTDACLKARLSADEKRMVYFT